MYRVGNIADDISRLFFKDPYFIIIRETQDQRNTRVSAESFWTYIQVNSNLC